MSTPHHITLATQGMQFFTETPETNPTPPVAAVAPVPPTPPPPVPATTPRVPIAAEPEPAEAELPQAETDEEDNQSHLSDSDRREGNAEESLLTPDKQVTGVVSQTLETHPECSPPVPTTVCKRSRQKRNKVTRLCYDSSGCQLVKK